MKTVIIIPARYQSSRFPGKPVVMVAGKSMIERVHVIAKAVADVEAVYVATDDGRIRDAAKRFGAEVIMTSSDCRNGTERVAEAMTLLKDDYDLYVNLQGDAPLTPPHFIGALIDAMAKDPDCDMGTPAVRCDAVTLAHFKEDRKNGRVGGTTVVTDAKGRALYFSKEVIPFTPEGPPPSPIPVFHHVGLYAYRPALLERYRLAQPGLLERLEGLEQLRVLENGGIIRVVEVDAKGRPFWEINNPEDVPRVEAALARHGLA
ncbi:MAG: 3-deoxy-manno-octulosonate cytidylyltransferase [Alphaproteobacteria bacterium]